jgi:alpha-beta hydrolase superfamily lysophospholipase
MWSAEDGYKGYYRLWRPTGTPRANIVCLHGIQSHGGWYEYSSGQLCQAGYVVWFPDRRGSGLNARHRGDCASYRQLLADVAEFLLAVREGRLATTLPGRGPGADLPVALMAGSWGAKLAVGSLRAYPGCADALILWSPGFFPQVRMTLRQKCKVVFWRLIQPDYRLPIPLNDPELFTANPERQRFIAQDELALRRATARFLLESARLDWYLRHAPRYVTCPVLLLLAGQDRIVDNAKTKRYFEQFASADKTLIEYPQAHHTLEFEPQPDFFIRDILSWLERVVPQLKRPQPSFPAPVPLL